MARILDPTTLKELLWRDAVVLVAELTGAVAEELLIAFLPHNIGLRYALLDGWRSPGFPLPVASAGPDKPAVADMAEAWINRDPTPHDLQFWHPDTAAGECLTIYREDSSARWTGPRKYLPGINTPPTDFKVTLIWLWRDDIIKVLRFVGLLPPAGVPAAPAAAPTPKSPPRGKVERWVHDHMKANPPKKGDHEYVGNLHELCPHEAEQKTIANYVGRYRKQFELPAEAPAKLPQSSRKAPGKVS
jgi:hypothetical protein